MEFHHIRTAGSTNGSIQEHSTVAADDLEIDAAQGGANKVSCLVSPHAYLARKLPRMPHGRMSLTQHLSDAWSVDDVGPVQFPTPAFGSLAGRGPCGEELYLAPIA